MAEQIQLRCARAYPEEIQKVREWFQKLEDVMNDDENSDSQYGEWLRKHYHEVEGKWERILLGYETMFDNACDPSLTYLAFKPEILEKMQQGSNEIAQLIEDKPCVLYQRLGPSRNLDIDARTAIEDIRFVLGIIERELEEHNAIDESVVDVRAHIVRNHTNAGVAVGISIERK